MSDEKRNEELKTEKSLLFIDTFNTNPCRENRDNFDDYDKNPHKIVINRISYKNR